MLEGRTVVVAGVGDGLGSQIGRLALREGANVVLAARSGAKLDEIASRLDPSGERVHAAHPSQRRDAATRMGRHHR